MTPGWGPVVGAADEGVASARVGAADEGDVAGDPAGAPAGAPDGAEADDCDNDAVDAEAAFAAFLALLPAAPFVVALPCAANGDVLPVFEAAAGGAVSADGDVAAYDVDAADVADATDAADAGDEPDPDAPAGAVAGESLAPVEPIAPAAPGVPRTGGFAPASGFGMPVVAATGAGITGCGNASRMTGDVALSSARVSGNGSGAVTQPAATSDAAIAASTIATRVRDAPDVRDSPNAETAPNVLHLEFGCDTSTSCSSRHRSDGVARVRRALPVQARKTNPARRRLA